MENKIEKIVLGEMLYFNNLQRAIDVLTNMESDLFLNEKNRLIFDNISKLVLQGTKPDSFSLMTAMQDKISYTEVSEISGLAYSDAEIEIHIEKLKELKYKRIVLEIIAKYGKEIKLGSFGKDIDELKNFLISDLSAISISEKSEFIKISEYKQKIIEHLGTNKSIEGYSWGINDLDAWTSGIVIPRIYVIGGLKKSGKTRFVIHCLTKLHDSKVPTAFLSMEMPGYEITKLLHASFTGLNDLRFRSSSLLSKEERYQFDNVQINEALLGIECQSGLGLNQVLTRIKRYAKMGYKIIFIDYIQRIKHGINKEAQELEHISTQIADSARLNNIAIVLLSQLNVNAENPHEPPNIGNLKGSGGIGEAADTILLFDNLYRRTKSESDKNKINIYLEQRYGDSGKLTLMADLGACRFRDLSERITEPI